MKKPRKLIITPTLWLAIALLITISSTIVSRLLPVTHWPFILSFVVYAIITIPAWAVFTDLALRHQTTYPTLRMIYHILIVWRMIVGFIAVFGLICTSLWIHTTIIAPLNFLTILLLVIIIKTHQLIAKWLDYWHERFLRY